MAETEAKKSLVAGPFPGPVVMQRVVKSGEAAGYSARVGGVRIMVNF